MGKTFKIDKSIRRNMLHKDLTKKEYNILLNMVVEREEYYESEIDKTLLDNLINCGLVCWEYVYGERVYRISEHGIIFMAEHQERLNLKPKIVKNAVESYDGEYYCRREYQNFA